MSSLKKQYGKKAKNVYYGMIVKGKLKGAEGPGGTGKLAKAKATYAKKHKGRKKKFNGRAYASARKKVFKM